MNASPTIQEKKKSGLANVVIGLIDWIAPVMVAVISGLTLMGGLVALLISDFYWGMLGVTPLTNHQLTSAIISLGGTGASLGLIGICIKSYRSKNVKLMFLVGVPVLVIGIIDIFFDGLAADVLRYGGYMVHGLPEGDGTTQWPFRIFIGTLSTMGAFVGAYALVTFKTLKEHLSQAFNEYTRV